MNNVPTTPSSLTARDVIEAYFDHPLYEGMAKAKQVLVWLAFERANGFISERIFAHYVCQAAAQNCFPVEHAQILADEAYKAFLHSKCHCKISGHDSETVASDGESVP